MNIKKFLCIVLLLCIGINLYGCQSKGFFSKLFSKEDEMEIIRSDEKEIEVTEDDGLRSTVLYFQNGDGFLVPVMRRIPWEEGIAKLAIKNMIDNPTLRENLEPTGLIPIIPPGTMVLGMSIDNETGACNVDFSKDFLNYNTKSEEENLIRGVVYTLTEFPVIKQVNILVEGKAIDNLKFGTEISSPLKREDINLIQGEGEYRSKVLVYYKGSDTDEFEYFVPVTVPTLAPTSNVYTALEELFKGAPSSMNLYSSIPAGAVFNGVEIRDGVAYVDVVLDSLDEENENYITEELNKGIGLTLGQFDEIEKVEMILNGKAIENLVPAFANEY